MASFLVEKIQIVEVYPMERTSIYRFHFDILYEDIHVECDLLDHIAIRTMTPMVFGFFLEICILREADDIMFSRVLQRQLVRGTALFVYAGLLSQLRS